MKESMVINAKSNISYSAMIKSKSLKSFFAENPKEEEAEQQ
jgi:hypothetical protein